MWPRGFRAWGFNMSCRLREFFEAENGRLSMTRLLCFLAWPPATYVLIKNPTPEMMAWYLGSFVLGYVGGKAADVGGLFAPKAGKGGE